MRQLTGKNDFLMALLFVASSCVALAQVSGSISGEVEDPSGAAIPAATVTITSLETGGARTVTTDRAGNYRALSLPVGRYEVRAEKEGFKTVVQTGINLVVGQEAVVRMKLEVGAVQQEVTVTGEAPLVNTTTASVSGLVGEKEVKDLPLNGRSFDLLITLNPGTINYSAMKTGGANGLGNYFSVAGRRPTENLFLLNGVEYTGQSNSGSVTPGGVSGQLLGIDAVREFNVISGSYSAEYGKRAGSQVSVVTQSGTNSLHGSLFEFLRNSDLDARNFFDYPPGLRIPPFRRNQFGGSAGGPIRKNQTFLFGNYEGFRQRLGLSTVAVVPDDNARHGLLPNPQGIPTSVTGLVPGMLPYMVFWPEPNGPNLGGGVALSYNNPRQSIREEFGTARLDQTFSDQDSLSAIYTVDDGVSLSPFADPLFGQTIGLRAQVVSVQETHIFSPQVINTFTAGFSRGLFTYDAGPLISFPSSLALIVGQKPGSIVIGSASATNATSITTPLSQNNTHIINARNLFTYADGVHIIKGNHQISAGVWFQRLRSNELRASRTIGQASFANLQSFLQGNMGTFAATLNSTPLGWRSSEGAWYVDDSIQLRPNLTFQLGLRHEFTNGTNEVVGRSSNYVFDSNGVFLTNPLLGSALFTKNNAKWLFGPRVALAWDPFGKGKTSIRAGFGRHYDLLDSLSFVLGGNPPYNGVSNITNVPFFSIVPVNPATAPLPPGCGPGVPSPCVVYTPRGLQPTAQTPSVHSWNFTVEQKLTANMALRVAYLGSRGEHAVLSIDPNSLHAQICSNPAGCISGGTGSARGTVPQGAEYLPVGTRLNPYLSFATYWLTEGNASYNALQVDLTRRFSRGLQFRGNYTWSKNLDIGSGYASSQATNEPQDTMNPYDLGRDWGPSALNIRHQASGSLSYELPLGRDKLWLKGVGGVADKLVSGWQVNGIVTLLSGFPFTPQVGSNVSGSGDGTNPDRPNVNPTFAGVRIIGLPNRWFNPNAYLLPTPGTFGNLGRGVLTGPGMADVDFSLFKNTRISERKELQFRAEAFNVLNRPNFGSPNPVVFSAGAISPSAGLITSTATASRQIQFGLKLIF